MASLSKYPSSAGSDNFTKGICRDHPRYRRNIKGKNTKSQIGHTVLKWCIAGEIIQISQFNDISQPFIELMRLLQTSLEECCWQF